MSRRSVEQPRQDSFTHSVDDLDPAVELPRGIVMADCRGPLLAVADGVNLRVGRAEQRHELTHRHRAPFAQRDVVLA